MVWEYNTKTLKKRLLIICLLFLTFFATMCNAETTKRYGYNLYPLNIRAEMDVKSKWMGQYPGGTTIELLEDLGEWYKVESGYVKAEYIYDVIEVYKYGRIIEDICIYAKADVESQIIGELKKDMEEIFIQKTNGFFELETGGFIEEKFVSFEFFNEIDVNQSVLSVNDMQMWKMPDLPILYIGSLKERTAGQGVTNKKTLYFRDDIPIYDIIDGEAYFPSGRDIYKVSLDKFSNIQNVGSEYEILGAYRTIYYTSSKSRKHNIELVSSFLDGTIIEPEKTFSYNKTTGPRSYSMGYKEAPVIEYGQYVTGYGGGVCQVSSTIYAALLHNKNFKVTARKPHGLPATYIPVDMDATVSYGSVDLKFVNKYPFNVRLNVKSGDGVCMVTITKAE